MFKKKKNNPRNPNLSSGESQVYSYRSARNDNDRQLGRESQKAKDAKLPQNNRFSGIKKVFKVLVIIAIILIVLGGMSYVKSVGILSVSDGSNKSKQQAYTDSINSQLKGSAMNKNFWFINQNRFTENLKKEFPEVQKVNYSYSLIDRVVNIQVQISQPVINLSSAGGLYLIDSRGRVIEENSQNSGLITLIDGDNREYIKGELALLTNNLNFVNNIIKQSEAKNLTIEKLSIEHGATEMYVKYVGDSYFVKYSLFGDPRLSFGAYIVAREKSGQAPTEYIDVRVADRAYIK
ncbi:MAG: hypothetical protein AAB914_03630 [Patescibacteria group bacterium]